jgi:hypothetical protein
MPVGRANELGSEGFALYSCLQDVGSFFEKRAHDFSLSAGA